MYRIKQLREENKLSQRALAQKIGVSPKAVNFWESGKVEPSARSICALSDEFACTCDYLLGREDDFGNVNVMKELSEAERFWLEQFRKLDATQRQEAMNFVDYLLNK